MEAPKTFLVAQEIEDVKDVIFAALKQVQGLKWQRSNWFFKVLASFSPKYFGGVTVGVNKKGALNIVLYIFVIFGYNIPEISLKAQEIVKRDLSKKSSFIINNISVHILGFERGPK